MRTTFLLEERVMSLCKPILLILFAGLLLSVYAWTRSVDAGTVAGFFAFALVAVVALAIFIWRPLREAAGSAADLAGKSSRSAVPGQTAEIGGLAQNLEAIRALLRDYERQLSHTGEQLRQSQTLLRESEELTRWRYAAPTTACWNGI
ncbi:MAG: hypothetical protein H0V78_12560 [Burkholderiales bacterium]|nr:hypothetical protein [Burkholderiales bacterium]